MNSKCETIQMKPIMEYFRAVLVVTKLKMVLTVLSSNLKIQMDNVFLVHVFHALQYLFHVPHNFLLREVVIITHLFEQLTSRNSTKTPKSVMNKLQCSLSSVGVNRNLTD